MLTTALETWVDIQYIAQHWNSTDNELLTSKKDVSEHYKNFQIEIRRVYYFGEATPVIELQKK